jgi:hypothetical protein
VDYPPEEYIRLQRLLDPYRVHVMHELKEPDKEKLLQYCRWFTHFIRSYIDISDTVFFCDEACFHLGGNINSQNSRIWSAEIRIPSMKDRYTP